MTHPANYVPLYQLTAVLDWLFRLREEDRSVYFALTGVEFGRVSKWSELYPDDKVPPRAMFDSVGRGLASRMRKADLVARDATVFWIVSVTHSTDSLFARIRALVESEGSVLLDRLPCTLHKFTLPFAHEGESAKDFLERFRLNGPDREPAKQIIHLGQPR